MLEASEASSKEKLRFPCVPLVLVRWDEVGLLEEEYDWIDLMTLLPYLYEACQTRGISHNLCRTHKRSKSPSLT